MSTSQTHTRKNRTMRENKKRVLTTRNIGVLVSLVLGVTLGLPCMIASLKFAALSFASFSDRTFLERQTIATGAPRPPLITSETTIHASHHMLGGLKCLDAVLAHHRSFRVREGHPASRHDNACLAPRTLFYIGWDYINTVMDRHFLYAYCAAWASCGHDDTCVALWGPGWPGWNASQTASENIASRWMTSFDMVILYVHEPSEVIVPGAVIATIREECVFHEIHHEENPDKWLCRAYPHLPQGAMPWKNHDIVLLKYKKDFDALQQKLSTEDDEINALIYLWHQAVPPERFVKEVASSRFEARPFDFCLIGYTDPYWYPLRAKVERWIADGVFAAHGIAAKQLSHFGYSDTWSKEALVEHGINYTTLETQYDNYVDFLFQCKSVLVTRSQRDYELKKYIETALAGALLIGNIPTRYADDPLFSSTVVDIHDAVSEDRTDDVVATIRSWLSENRSHERQARIEKASNLMLRYRTTQRAWESMQEAFHAYVAGRRGFVNYSKLH
jgi:hypothetical protein